jgi:hypothetical protein
MCWTVSFCLWMYTRFQKSHLALLVKVTCGLGVLRRTGSSVSARSIGWSYPQREIREDWMDQRPSPSNLIEDSENWKKSWKTNVTSKVRIFGWSLAHNSLLVAVLQARNMVVWPDCQICNASKDSWRHSLLDCTMARCVWALVDEDVTEHMVMNTLPNAKQLLFATWDTLDHSNFKGERLFTRVFLRVHSVPLIFFNCFISDLGEAKTSKQTRNLHKQNCRRRWIRPPVGVVKINVDGAVAHNEDHGSISAVCRDSHGLFMGPPARTIKGIYQATFEAMACA